MLPVKLLKEQFRCDEIMMLDVPLTGSYLGQFPALASLLRYGLELAGSILDLYRMDNLMAVWDDKEVAQAFDSDLRQHLTIYANGWRVRPEPELNSFFLEDGVWLYVDMVMELIECLCDLNIRLINVQSIYAQQGDVGIGVRYGPSAASGG